MKLLKSRSTNIDLIKTARSQRIPLRWVGFKDTLSSQPVLRGLYIVNMESSYDGSGTHWVCFWLGLRDALYFDSFGISPPIEIEEFLKRGGYKSYYMNAREIQNVNSGYCGSFCLEFGEFMAKHKKRTDLTNFKSFIELFNRNPLKNLPLLKVMMGSNLLL